MSMRMRFVAVAVGTLLITIAWFMLIFRPASSRLSEVREEIETTRTEIAALETKLAQLQELQRNEESLRNQAARFARALPDKPALSTFIRQVHKIAGEANMDWVSVSPSAPGAPGASAGGDQGGSAALRSIGVSLSANGGFFQVEEFIDRFQRLDRAVRIDTFSLGGGEGSLSLSLTMQIYMSAGTPPAPAPAPAPAEAAPDPATEG